MLSWYAHADTVRLRTRGLNRPGRLGWAGWSQALEVGGKMLCWRPTRLG